MLFDAKRLIKSILKIVHSLIARSKLVSFLYLVAVSLLLRKLPLGKFKNSILGTLWNTTWPEIELPPYDVIVGESTCFRIHPHLNEFDMEALVSKKISYEEEVFRFLEPIVTDYDVILEIGANFGIYTLFFVTKLARFPDTNSYHFEPSKKAHNELIKNLKANCATNVNVYNVAVGKETSFAKFYESIGHLTNCSLDKEFSKIFSDKIKEENVLVVSGQMLGCFFLGRKNILIKIDAEVHIPDDRHHLFRMTGTTRSG